MQSATAVDQSVREPSRSLRRPRRRRSHRRGPHIAVPPARRRAVDRIAAPAALLLFLLISILIHAGVNGWVAWLSRLPHPVKTKIRERIEMAVVEKQRPPPPPPPPKVEPPKVDPPKPPPPRPHPVELAKPIKPPPLPPPVAAPPPKAPPPPTAAPPPPNAPPPKATAAPPVLIPGLSLSSTSTAGSFAVQTGNTLYGAPGKVAAKPEDVKAYRAEHAENYVPSYSLAQQPEYTDNMSADEMKKFYPAEAKRNGEEGQTVVKLEIDAHGNVTKVTVVGDPGHGFAEASKLFGIHMKFKPGRDASGNPCSTTLSWTINWELD